MKGKLCALTALMLLAGGCASTIPDYESRTHIVSSGETLSAIAFRYGIDYESLVAWNGLSNPDLIYAGQRIRLSPPSGAAASTAARPAASVPATRPPTREDPSPRWQTPTDGRIVSTFGSREGIASGIAIAGRAGQPVNAAAAGRVVYAGTGLIGYGQLLIIRHNDTYLSAYGHNSRLIVAQGENVARGQKIAEMGLGPDQTPRLHFEIRRNGVPVNPMQYLSRN